MGHHLTRAAYWVVVACVSNARDVSVVSRGTPPLPNLSQVQVNEGFSPGRRTAHTLFIFARVSPDIALSLYDIENNRFTATMNQLFLSTLLAQLWLAFLAVAAPVGDEIAASSKDNAWEYGTSGGIIGIIVLILDLIVFGTSEALYPEAHISRASVSPANKSVAFSRGPAVHPVDHVEARLVPRRLPVPRRRHGRLLALLEPRGAQAGRRVRGPDVGDSFRIRRVTLAGRTGIQRDHVCFSE